MTETPSSSAGEPEAERSGSSEPDPNATSRLPPIRRHDENLDYNAGFKDITEVRSGDPSSSDPSSSDLRSSDVGSSDLGATPAGAAPVTGETTRLPPAEYTPAGSFGGGAAPRYQAPTTSAAFDEADETDQELPVPRRGPGLAAALGIAGLTAAAMGLYALPLQQQPRSSEVLFGQLRSAAAFDRVASITGSHSTSLVGGQLATTFWRYGGLGVIGGLAFLVILAFAWAPLRLAGGILTFLGGVGALVYLGLAARETNKFETAVVSFRADRMAWADWRVGFWVAAGGLAVVAFSGLLAIATRRR